MGILSIFPYFMQEWLVISFFIFLTTFLFYFFFKNKKFINYGIYCFIVTTLAYFSPNQWIFALFLIFFLVNIKKNKSNLQKIEYFLLLFPILPGVKWIIPLPGNFNQLFTLNYQLILIIIILLPIFIKYLIKKENTKWNKVDLFIILFLLYAFFMSFRTTTWTNAIRGGVFNLFITIFVPYFVITRTIKKEKDFKELFWPIIFSASILAFVGIFETLKHWHIYGSFAGKSIGSYFKTRGGFYRSIGTFGNSIPFGIYFVIISGYLIYLRFLKNKKTLFYNLLIGLFFLGMLSSLSRGPLLGYFVFFVLLLMFMKKNKFLKLAPLLLILILIIFVLPFGNVITSTLPFVGRTNQGSIDYRQRVWENSIEVIKDNPLTGNINYKKDPRMESLRQGEGIIDLLSYFIIIGLKYGLLGLILYSLIYITSLIGLIKKKISTKSPLNYILLPLFISTLIMINTVSSISILPSYVWMLIAFCSAYISLPKEKHLK